MRYTRSSMVRGGASKGAPPARPTSYHGDINRAVFTRRDTYDACNAQSTRRWKRVANRVRDGATAPPTPKIKACGQCYFCKKSK